VKTLEHGSATAANPTISANATHPTIAATATALPEHKMTRQDMRYYLGRVFDIPERRLEAMMAIVDNAQVDQRHGRYPRPTKNISSTPFGWAGKPPRKRCAAPSWCRRILT
jgi:hypothetical protein